MRGYWRWALCVAFIAGCLEAAETAPADVDIEKQADGGHVEADSKQRDSAQRPPRPAPACDYMSVQDAHERSVARALEASCGSDEDCILTERFSRCIGGCSIAIPTVSLAAFEAAQAADVAPHCSVLQEAGCTLPPPTCKSVRAACIERRCAFVSDHDAGGSTECPAGTALRSPGCGTPEPTWEKGCYAGCSDDTGCAPGYTCEQTSVDPCAPKPGQTDTCAACGQLTRLCLERRPSPSECPAGTALVSPGCGTPNRRGRRGATHRAAATRIARRDIPARRRGSTRAFHSPARALAAGHAACKLACAWTRALGRSAQRSAY